MPIRTGKSGNMHGASTVIIPDSTERSRKEIVSVSKLDLAYELVKRAG